MEITHTKNRSMGIPVCDLAADFREKIRTLNSRDLNKNFNAKLKLETMNCWMVVLVLVTLSSYPAQIE